MKKKICVVSGSRADYSLLRGVLRQIRKSRLLRLQLVVTGAHLSRAYGWTVREIERDGFTIHARVPLPLGQAVREDIFSPMGSALAGLGRAFARLRPDLILLLGDRYEVFCAAAAATSLGIPLGHFHGGEITRGAMDDAFRHAITKMSHVHFTATRRARKKVIQMGEPPATVHWVGAPGLDGIERQGRISRGKLEKILGVRLRKRNLLVTFHPVTLEKGRAFNQIRDLCAVLHRVPDALVVFTGVHPDPDGGLIQKEISRFVKTHPHGKSVLSLGGEAYLSLMRHVDAVVGNSSSGLIEAPSVGCWTLNIGARQEGREAAGNVVHVKCQREAMEKGLLRILRKSGGRTRRQFRNPYARKGTHRRVIRILERVSLNKNLKKTFFDLEKSCG